MVPRRLLVAAVSVTVAVAAAGIARDAAGAAPLQTVYRLRRDTRMCPSTACGGYWASRVNFRSTTCLGGAAFPTCYATSVDLSALTPVARRRARLALPSAGTLVEGRFTRYSAGAFPQLAKLVAARVWIAGGSSSTAGTVYRVVDTGIRCVRAPCFSLRATVVNGTRSLMLSGLDLAHTGATPATVTMSHEAAAHGGVLVSGTITAVTEPGPDGPARTLAATQVWLPA